MPEIEINNLTGRAISEDFLKKTALLVLKEEIKESRGRKKVVSIVLVGPYRIRNLNRIYRGKNRVTDVLSFSARDVKREFASLVPEEERMLGEIVICLKTVKKQARRFRSSFEKELTRVLIHGLLHLLGYDHERSEKRAKEMKEKEDYYLKKVFNQ